MFFMLIIGAVIFIASTERRCRYAALGLGQEPPAAAKRSRSSSAGVSQAEMSAQVGKKCRGGTCYLFVSFLGVFCLRFFLRSVLFHDFSLKWKIHRILLWHTLAMNVILQRYTDPWLVFGCSKFSVQSDWQTVRTWTRWRWVKTR